ELDERRAEILEHEPDALRGRRLRSGGLAFRELFARDFRRIVSVARRRRLARRALARLLAEAHPRDDLSEAVTHEHCRNLAETTEIANGRDDGDHLRTLTC